MKAAFAALQQDCVKMFGDSDLADVVLGGGGAFPRKLVLPAESRA